MNWVRIERQTIEKSSASLPRELPSAHRAMKAIKRGVVRYGEISFMKSRSVVSKGFSTAQAARLAGLTPRQLDHWDRLGFLRPSLSSATGYGSARRYSFTDVVRLKVAARLRASGLGLSRIRRCAEALARLDEKGAGDLARARLVVAGSRVLWARSDQELVDLANEGQLVLVFSLGRTIEALSGAATRLSGEAETEETPARTIRRRRRIL